MNLDILEKIGLTESEVKVYLAMLKLGQSTAGPIVDESQVTRSKIYDILERLKHKGLVSYIIKSETKYFSAADPNNLTRYLDNEEKEIKQKREEIKELIPELEKYYKSAIGKNIAEIFIGMKGMETAFNVLVKEFSSDEIQYVFGAGKGEDVEKIQIFFERFHRKRVEKKIKARIIFNEDSRGLFSPSEKSKLVEVKYLLESTPAAINIYKNHTIIAILLKDPITLLIHNKEVADSFKDYFKAMWKIAKK